MQGVRGSNPRTSTKKPYYKFLLSKGLSTFLNPPKTSRDRYVSVYVSVKLFESKMTSCRGNVIAID